MKALWCKNQENPSDRISHAWAPLSAFSLLLCQRLFLFHQYIAKERQIKDGHHAVRLGSSPAVPVPNRWDPRPTALIQASGLLNAAYIQRLEF